MKAFILSMHTFCLKCPVIQSGPTCPSPSEVFRSTSAAHRGMYPYTLEVLGRATQRLHSLTGNLLLTPLSTASKLHFCFSDVFFPPLPHLQCWCVDRPPLIASPRPWFNGDRDASLRPRGATGCIPNGHAALESHGWERHQCVGGRGNPAQRGTTEIRRYSMQQHRRALLQQLRSSAELIWI